LNHAIANRLADFKALDSSIKGTQDIRRLFPEAVQAAQDRLVRNDPNRYWSLAFSDLNENQLFANSVVLFQNSVKDFADSIERARDKGFISPERASIIKGGSINNLKGAFGPGALSLSAGGGQLSPGILQSLQGAPNSLESLLLSTSKRLEDYGKFIEGTKGPEAASTDAALKSAEEAKKQTENQKETNRRLDKHQEQFKIIEKLLEANNEIVGRLLLPGTKDGKEQAVILRVLEPNGDLVNKK